MTDIDVENIVEFAQGPVNILLMSYNYVPIGHPIPRLLRQYQNT